MSLACERPAVKPGNLRFHGRSTVFFRAFTLTPLTGGQSASRLPEGAGSARERPVASSSLIQIPLVQRLLPPGKRVGVLPVRGDRITAGLAAVDAPLDAPAEGTESGREFTRVLLNEELEMDYAAEQDILEAGERLLARRTGGRSSARRTHDAVLAPAEQPSRHPGATTSRPSCAGSTPGSRRAISAGRARPSLPYGASAEGS